MRGGAIPEGRSGGDDLKVVWSDTGSVARHRRVVWPDSRDMIDDNDMLGASFEAVHLAQP